MFLRVIFPFLRFPADITAVRSVEAAPGRLQVDDALVATDWKLYLVQVRALAPSCIILNVFGGRLGPGLYRYMRLSLSSLYSNSTEEGSHRVP